MTVIRPTSWRASRDALDEAEDILLAGQDILRYGNELFNDLNDAEAYRATVDAVERVLHHLVALDKLVRPL